MAKIKIYFSGVKAANAELLRVLKRLDQLSDEIQILRQELDPEIQARYDISVRLERIKREAAGIRTQAKKLHTLVDDGVIRYQRADSRLCREAPDSSVLPKVRDRT